MLLKGNINQIKGVGEKTASLFRKLHIETVEQLIRDYPRDYHRYEEPVSLNELEENTMVTVAAFLGAPLRRNHKGHLDILSTVVQEQNAKLTLTWFNMPFLVNTLKRGSYFLFHGRITLHNNMYVMEQPEVYTAAKYSQIQGSMQPIYNLTKGLSNKLRIKAMEQVILQTDTIGDYLPEDIIEKYQMEAYWQAVKKIHFPKSMEEYQQARGRLAFDEFLLFILAVWQLKEHGETIQNQFPMKPVWDTEQLIENLPYELTNAQKNVWQDIEKDLAGQTVMSRLVQGDVGSGKTIVAFLAMIMCVNNQYQAALMAPTEVLARQHYLALSALVRDYHIENSNPVLLTGSMTQKEKREAYDKIRTGDANMIIGTHAIIQESVEYQKLGLVVIDEQHRFGVKQREAIAAKGEKPNVLVMSATPIPRTLAIILYGDLDISVIDELPARRLPIKNCVVDTSYRKSAYQFMKKEIQAGHQVYIICPMVEESENMDGENVLEYTDRLRNYFNHAIIIACLHGKMKSSEKSDIMEKFSAGEIKILVSTTVIEVGVDVPNATIMMVENAERFGLAQLHQLRGRVGRGDAQSYCIFMQGSKKKENQKRLEILNKSNDGFYIAGEDLKLRGPGDLFGIRQSGLMDFRIGDIYQDAAILQKANETAREIVAEDCYLESPKYQLLSRQLEVYRSNELEGFTL